MKILPYLIIFLGGLYAPAQTGLPPAFAVHYTYGEAHGIPAGNAFTVMDQLEDGSLVMRIYGKAFFRLTPTGARIVPFGSSLKDFLITEIAATGSGKGIFYGMNCGLIQLQGDSLQAYGPKFSAQYARALPDGQHLVSYLENDSCSLHLFDGRTYTRLNWPTEILPLKKPYIYMVSNIVLGGFRIGVRSANGPVYLLRYEPVGKKLLVESTFPAQTPNAFWRVFNEDSLLLTVGGGVNLYYRDANKGRKPFPTMHLSNGDEHLLAFNKGNYTLLKDYKPGGMGEIPLTTTEMAAFLLADRFYNSVYLGLQTNPHRVFPHIRQYPQLYANGQSLGTHLIAQTADGNRYFGSYAGYTSRLINGKLQPIDVKNLRILSGGIALDNQVLMFAELAEGILRLKADKLAGITSTNKNYGFYLLPSRDSSRVFAGMGNYCGIGIISRADMLAGRPNWRFIDSTKGMRLMNVLTIAEDPTGRLWFGRISQGWGVYDVKKDTASSFLRQEGTTSFGVMASYCDHKGMVWLGGSDGLWVADGNKLGKIEATDAQRINHPLLSAGTEVVSMARWGYFLVFNANQRLQLLDLNHFHQNRHRILAGKMPPVIHYINPQELPLSPQAQWDQNCFFTDKIDSTLWAGANNNVYRIDLKTWLGLKRPYATPQVLLTTGEDTLLQTAGARISVAPTQNSLSVDIRYQTTDNLPRLLQVALVAEGDSIRWSAPSTETHFEARNKQTGDYQLLVRLIEHDGTLNEFTFPFTIRRFWWQQWWFWLLLSLAAGGVVFYVYYLHKQKQLAEANAARIAAEAEALRAEQQRQLTAMQVKSLSTQFRPHFILNALNTVGAQLYDKPDVDAVLGQLGDSIGIIFRNAQAGSIAHPLAQEWQLVRSVINIKQMEMRHSVQVHWQVAEHLFVNTHYQVPMGLLQIPVENALVHGLRNKEDGARNLWIKAEANPAGDLLTITITDDGIGRKAAAALGNHRSNGVGSRNLEAILQLLNAHNLLPMTMTMVDLPLIENGMPCGTRVIINIPQHYSYAYEQLKPNSTALPGS